MPLAHDTIVRLLISKRATLMGYIRAIVHDDHLAEDIFQELSIAALQKRDQIKDEQHFGGWIRQAARIEAAMTLRKRGKAPFPLSAEVLDLIDPHWTAVENRSPAGTTKALRHCLAQLTPYARKLIELRYKDGKTGECLAEATGRKLNTVYVALSRAHGALAVCIREELAKEGDDEC